MRWRDLLLLAVVSAVVAIAVGTHGIAHWDAADYVRLSVEGTPSTLLLGRPLFLASCRWIVNLLRDCGVGSFWVEPTLRYFWTGVSSLAPPLLAVLCRRVGFSSTAAWWAGVALALSPSFAHTAHQVLTDAPALVLCLASMVVALDTPKGRLGRAAMAGAFLGAAVSMRETALAMAPAVLWMAYAPNAQEPRSATCAGNPAASSSRRHRLMAVALVVCVAVVVVAASIVWLRDGHRVTRWDELRAAVQSWRDAMSASSARYPWGPREFGLSLLWTLAIGPWPILAVIAGWVTGGTRVPSRAWPLVGPSLAASAMLLFFADGSLSPRYMLAAAPLAFLPLAGPTLAARPRWTLVLCCASCSLVWPATARHRREAARAENFERWMAPLPDRSMLIAGHACPVIQLQRTLAETFERSGEARRPPHLRIVCPGWSWPGDDVVLAAIARSLAEGHAVTLDLCSDSWTGPRERPSRDFLARELGVQPTCEGWITIPPSAPSTSS